MTLMLNLSPETEARLHEMASRHGQKPEEYALSLLDKWLREDEQGFAEAVAAVHEGLTDLEAGDRGMLLEDYRAEIVNERTSRRQDTARTNWRMGAPPFAS